MNKVYLFPITIEVCEEGGFFAKCSILQGCHAEGKTYAEVIENIQDVIRIHIEARKKHGEPIPSIDFKKKIPLSVNIKIPVGV